MTDNITVLIADDHGVVREGLRSMLEREGFSVLGEASNGKEAIDLAKSLQPQVVLLDIRMPDLDGLQALSAIKAAHPEMCVIMLTSYANPAYLAQAVSHGAAGYLSKEIDPERIPVAIRAAANGDHLLDRELLRMTLSSATAVSSPIKPPPTTPTQPITESLSQAEIRVLRLVADGLDNANIAISLSLSINTVKTHVRHILAKLHVSDRTQAALWAVRNGVID